MTDIGCSLWYHSFCCGIAALCKRNNHLEIHKVLCDVTEEQRHERLEGISCVNKHITVKDILVQPQQLRPQSVRWNRWRVRTWWKSFKERGWEHEYTSYAYEIGTGIVGKVTQVPLHFLENWHRSKPQHPFRLGSHRLVSFSCERRNCLWSVCDQDEQQAPLLLNCLILSRS